MKNNIRNLLNIPETNGTYGVEIEAEGTKLPSNLNGVWRIDQDPSLKAGFESFEYVMPYPSSLAGVKDALNVLKNAYKRFGTKIYETITSGVHVHVNVQELTPKKLFTFITCYFALEELLVNYCGPQRVGNHFCLRAKDAEWIVHRLTQAAQTRNLSHLKTDQIRYCSLNAFSLFKYGSLEFRAMRGTGDLDSIYEWVEIIDQIHRNSLMFNSPSDAISSMSFHGEENFVKTLLGPKADLFLKYPNIAATVREGVRIIQPLAYSVNWDTYKDINNNPFVKAL